MLRLIVKKFILISLSAIAAFQGFSQDITPKYSNEFLSIGVGASALGQSNAVVAGVDDVTASYWNPAGLTNVDDFLQIGAMHAEYFAGIAKYDYIGLAKPIDDKSTAGFTFIRFGVDDIPNTTQLIDAAGNIDYDKITTFTAGDYGFLFSYARKMPIEGLSVGGNFKVIYRHVGSFANSWGFGLDAGINYKLNDHWRFGGVIRDILVNDVPMIFQKEIYATISIFGGSLYFGLHYWGLSGVWIQVLAIMVIIVLRSIVVHFEIKLPSIYVKR